jgi:hypothetical protein
MYALQAHDEFWPVVEEEIKYSVLCYSNSYPIIFFGLFMNLSEL